MSARLAASLLGLLLLLFELLELLLPLLAPSLHTALASALAAALSSFAQRSSQRSSQPSPGHLRGVHFAHLREELLLLALLHELAPLLAHRRVLPLGLCGDRRIEHLDALLPPLVAKVPRERCGLAARALDEVGERPAVAELGEEARWERCCRVGAEVEQRAHALDVGVLGREVQRRAQVVLLRLEGRFNVSAPAEEEVEYLDVALLTRHVHGGSLLAHARVDRPLHLGDADRREQQLDADGVAGGRRQVEWQQPAAVAQSERGARVLAAREERRDRLGARLSRRVVQRRVPLRVRAQRIRRALGF